MGVVGRGQLMYDRNTAVPAGKPAVNAKDKPQLVAWGETTLCHAINQRFQTMDRKYRKDQHMSRCLFLSKQTRL